MKWNCASRKIYLFLSVAAFGCGAAQFSYAEAGNRINVRVDGMVCYSCAYGIQKICKVEKLGKGYEKDIEKGLFKINLGPQEKIPAPKIVKDIVKNAGYTYKGAHLELTGALLPSRQQSKYGVQVSETDQILWVDIKPELENQLAQMNGSKNIMLFEAGEKPDTWTLVSINNPDGENNKVQ